MFKLPSIAVQETVPGREVLIDADCVAYYGAAGCDDLPLRSATRRVDLRMQQIITETRAESYTGYLTGDNNFRDLVATLQRYKGNRYDENGKRITKQPAWLKECRLYLETVWDCAVTYGQEADDALSIRHNRTDHETIISTIDKDLLINSGLHHDMNNGEIFESKGFGKIWMKSNQCKGYGLKFFCTQLLMGDSADWIKGLPKVTPMMKERYGIKRLGGCGPKAAFLVINPCKSYKKAMKEVVLCYKDFWSKNSYKHWRTDQEYKSGEDTALKQLTEQGQLLWMRREENQVWDLNMKL